MTLRRKIFVRTAGLVTGMIVVVTWLSCAFAAQHHRDSTVELFREQLAVLSNRAEEPVAWDDRPALVNLLQEMVNDRDLVEYAFVEKVGRPHVHTFKTSVPREFLARAPEAASNPTAYELRNLRGERFIHLTVAIGDEAAVLHSGLSVRKINFHVRRLVLSIVMLGACATLVGIAFAAVAARLTTREIDDPIGALHSEIDEYRQTQRELARHRDRLEGLVEDKTHALARATVELRHEHETALFEHRRFIVMVDSIHAGIVFFGVDGRAAYVNSAAADILGRDRDELMGLSVDPHLLAGDHRDPSKLFEQYVGRDTWTKVNECHELDMDVIGIRHDDHSPAGSMVIVRDRTAERKLRRLMTEQEKIAGLGTLAAGIAHEINNPLDGVQNCLRRIIRDPTNTEQIERYAGLMTASLHHIETVVQQLLNLSHKRDRIVRKIDVNEAVRGAVELARAGQRWNGVEVEWRLDDDLPPVLADPQNLTQVFLNLVLNAVDAMPAGGTLTVTTRFEASHDTGSSEEDVLVEIRDTGRGIAPEVLPRIFEPFFTTKGHEKGTGLGLSVSRNLVVEHGGEIDVKSEPGVGTTFCVRLPRFFPARGARPAVRETSS